MFTAPSSTDVCYLSRVLCDEVGYVRYYYIPVCHDLGGKVNREVLPNENLPSRMLITTLCNTCIHRVYDYALINNGSLSTP